MYSILQKNNEIVTVMSRILQNIVIKVQFETSKGLNSGGLNVVQVRQKPLHSRNNNNSIHLYLYTVENIIN